MIRSIARIAGKAALVLFVFLYLTVIQSSQSYADLVKPNIILFLTDDQTFYSFGRMPYLNSLPQGSWAQFSNAFASTPLCAPSRASILTGRYGHTVKVPTNNGEKFVDTETIGVWLQRAGYRTSYIGKYLNEYPWKKPVTFIPPGWNDWHVFVKSISYGNYNLNENGTLNYYGNTTESYSTDVLNQKALSFVSGTTSPFFMILAYNAPHAPMSSAVRHKSLTLPTPVLPGNFNEADVSDKPAWIRALRLRSVSDAQNKFKTEVKTMRSVDESIQSIIELLAATSRLDNTVLIFMTDNGYSHGSHRWDGKVAVYDEPIRAPLLIRYPGINNFVEPRFVSNVDINPTLVEIAGASAVLSPHGASLLPLIQGTASTWRDSLLLVSRSGKEVIPTYWGIRTEAYKYVELDSGERELYDLTLDPLEMDNHAGQPEYAEIQQTLAVKLLVLKQQAN